MPKEHRLQSCHAALGVLSVHHVEQERGRRGKDRTGWRWMGWPASRSSTSILKHKMEVGASLRQFSSEHIYFSLSISKLKVCFGPN